MIRTEAGDFALTVMSDDPADGPSSGPRGRKIAGPFDAAVVWSGADSEGVWAKIYEMSSRLKLIVVLTQERHHAAWVHALPMNIPLLEISPSGRTTPRGNRRARRAANCA